MLKPALLASDEVCLAGFAAAEGDIGLARMELVAVPEHERQADDAVEHAPPLL